MPDREKVIKDLEKIHTHFWVKYRGCGIKAEKAKYQERLSVIEDAISLLKEQEAAETKTGHWIFESAYCDVWTHTCSECGKRMTTAYNTYANCCRYCGAKMEGR